ncbi:MAG: hypothetical protein JOY71_27075 [Acetobacteraceae bacterium]|nr:hypothetical protein [Acetobacteraceae bacterium]
MLERLFERLEQRLDRIDQRLDRIEQRTDERFERMEQRLMEMDRRFAEMDRHFTDRLARIEGMITQLPTMWHIITYTLGAQVTLAGLLFGAYRLSH